jgi:hypothetical protein
MMSRPKILKLQAEVDEIMAKFSSNRFLMAEAFLQIIHRENIITGNRIRARHGEQEIIPEPVMYQTNNPAKLEWIIDVPKKWYSLTGKDKS